MAVVSAIIPCLDEETAIGPVVTAVLAQNVNEVIVVDGGSRDRTAERARAAGARVIVELRRGLWPCHPGRHRGGARGSRCHRLP
jgi:glycosyltransferase involved in cell wall biosynthesis